MSRFRHCLVALPFLLVACGSDDAASGGGGGTVNVQISGEELGTSGFPFPEGGEAHIVDGWAIEFSHVLVTIGNFTLSSNPDTSPSDQSRIGGVVARANGPWAVDLAKDGPVTAEGGEGTAFPLATIGSLDNGDAFASDERYAVSYETDIAEASAERVDFDGEADELYDRMIDEGYSVLYVGTATFSGETCESSNPDYDFERLPRVVRFELGFAAPTAYVNCQNQANQGDAFADEEYQRGLAIPRNQAATAQITFHLEHAFYSALRHEPPLFFDQIAARLVGEPDERAVTLDDFTGIDPTAFVDGQGMPLPSRSCDGSAVATPAQRGFDLGSVPLDPGADPRDALRDYRDFITFVTSTQGHFNGGEGLCFVDRKYPAPAL